MCKPTAWGSTAFSTTNTINVDIGCVKLLYSYSRLVAFICDRKMYSSYTEESKPTKKHITVFAKEQFITEKLQNLTHRKLLELLDTVVSKNILKSVAARIKGKK